MLDNLVKEILAELVDYNELSEELGNMCKFLEEGKALIEQLIDKQVKDLEEALSECQHINATISKEIFSYDTERRAFLNGRGSPLNKCFKEMLYDQVKKAKEFSEKLSKKNEALKMEDLSLGCNSSGSTAGLSVRDNSSKAYPEVVVTESNNSDGENKSQQLEKALKIQSKQSESQIEGLKTQLNDKSKELDDANQKVAHLEREQDNIRQDLAAKTRELDETKAQLEGNGRKLYDANKNVLKLREDLRLEKSNQQVTVNNLSGEITQLTQALEKTKKQLKESESENKELNEKFLEASTNSKGEVITPLFLLYYLEHLLLVQV